MSVSAATNGATKGLIIGAIGLVVAPQLGLIYLAQKAAQFGAQGLADEHNGHGSAPKSKEDHFVKST